MKTRILILAGMVLCGATALHAQVGCTNSPECPTALLAMVGAGGFAMLRRFKK